KRREARARRCGGRGRWRRGTKIMSIRDRGYQGYQGARTPALRRWTVVLRETLRMTAKQPWVIAILIIAVFPPLIGGGVMYKVMSELQNLLGQASADQIDPAR